MIVHLSVRQPCASWSLAHSDKKPGLLATSLVSRLEIFCLRLAAASHAGAAARPKLLVAGWLAEVDTAPFVKRGFKFNGEPNACLGFKLLKDPAAPKQPAKHAADSPSAPPATAHQGKRKRSAAEGESAAGPSSAAAARSFEPWPVRRPTTGMPAAASQSSSEPRDALEPEPDLGEGAGLAAADVPAEVQPMYTFGGGDGAPSNPLLPPAPPTSPHPRVHGPPRPPPAGCGHVLERPTPCALQMRTPSSSAN